MTRKNTGGDSQPDHNRLQSPDQAETRSIDRRNRGPFREGVSRDLVSVSTGPVTPVTPSVLNRIHPTRAGAIDPERLVWEPDAFPAFARSEDYYMARQILGSATRRWREPKSDAPQPDTLLTEVRCGHPSGPHGGRCAARLNPAHINGGWVYTSNTCARGTPPHRNAVPAHFVEAAVVRMTAAAYQAHRLEAAVRSVSTRTEAMYVHVQRLTEAWSTATDLCNAASDRALEADIAHDYTERDHWNEQVIRHRNDRQATREQLDAAQKELVDAQTPRQLEQRLGTLRTIGERIPELLTSVAHDRARLRELLGILVRDVCVRPVATFMAVVEVTFPNGSSSRELITFRLIISSQPARAFALARTRAGADPEVIAQELTTGQARGEERVIMTPGLTRTLALVAKYFETEAARPGPEFTAEAIAGQTGTDPQVVRYALMSGVLGPATVDATGTMRVAPTDRELEAAFPTFAAARAESRVGWAPGDAVLRPVLERDFGMTEMAITWRAKRDSSVYTSDLTGRRYFRLSAFGFAPGAAQAASERYAARRRFDPASIADAVAAAGFPRDSAADFQPQATIVDTLRGAGFAVGASSLLYAQRHGKLLRIPCCIRPSFGHGKPLTVLIWCPQSLCTNPSAATIRAWLRGELPMPVSTADSPDTEPLIPPDDG